MAGDGDTSLLGNSWVVIHFPAESPVQWIFDASKVGRISLIISSIFFAAN